MIRCTFLLFACCFFSRNLFAQTDTVPPVLACKSHIEVGIPIPCFTITWADDFIDSVTDNSTSGIQLGIRKTCTGGGFPENKSYVTFLSSEWGPQHVDIWARDNAGNTSSCTVSVSVDDIGGSCDPGFTIITETPQEKGIANSKITASGENCLSDSFSTYGYTYGVSGSWSNFGTLIPGSGYESLVTPTKNINPLNGVSTNDLVLISKHILGLQALDSPYKIIAADANQDGKVTSFDVVVLRKLILGITDELPNGKSWRFVPSDYVFPNPANPFQPPFPERIEVPNTADPAPSFFKFTGVKIGDVNYSADPGQ